MGVEAVAGAAAVVADPVDTEEAAAVGISRPSVAVDTAIGGAKEVVPNGSMAVVAAAAKEVTEVATAEVAAVVVVVHGITTASIRRIRIGIAM